MTSRVWIRSFLSGISKSFYSKDVSAVYYKDRVLKGNSQHDGGVAIIWWKQLGNCKVVDFYDNRIMLFEIQCGQMKLLFVNIYMSYCITDNFHDFIFYLGKRSSVISDANTPYIFTLGDYNANANVINCWLVYFFQTNIFTKVLIYCFIYIVQI